MIYGYARVSTEAQDYESQVGGLRAAGAEKIVAEKMSGAVAVRRPLERLIAGLLPGDCVLVTKLDRLGRTLAQVLASLDAITKAGATFRVLDVPALDTTSPYGKLLIGVLGSLAEFERSLILSRTSEGRAAAKKAGVKFGRKPALSQFQAAEARARREAGESLQAIARTFGCSHSTISRLGK
jgi:DNA invertase Pin-like site-specific DNA recombinase